MKKFYLLLGLILLFVACKKDEKPVVLTGEPSNVEAYSVNLEGTLVDDYGYDVSEVGFILGTNREDVENQTNITKCIGTLKGASITASLTNLIPGKVYYYCAYAINKNELGRGEVKLFQTTSDRPEVTLNTINTDDIGVTTIKVSGKIGKTNGADIATWGFYYTTGDNNIHPIYNPTLNSDSSFSATFTGLTSATKYIIYAVAQNAAGITYSEGITVTTKTFVEDFINSFVNAGVNISACEVNEGLYYEINDPDHPIESSDWGFAPLSNLSYNEILDFITKLNKATSMSFRLPTLAEWTAAADNSYIYSGSNSIDDVAWYAGNSNNKAHHTGMKTANKFGLYDMSGNVWEMTKTPNADGNSHYICGGCFNSDSDQCKVTSNMLYPDGSRTIQVGFRLVK